MCIRDRADTVSRDPCEERSWSTTPRRAVSPRRRNAFGVSRKLPSGARSRMFCWRSAFSRSASRRASTEADSPSWRSSASRSMSSRRAPGYDWPSCSASASSSARSAIACAPSPRPSGSWPRKRADDVQSSPGRRRCSKESKVDSCEPIPPKACWDKADSSARWASVIEFIMRCAAAERVASASMSSSTLRGFSGKNSPCLRMKSSKRRGVSGEPAACASSSEFRSRSIRWMRRTSSESTLDSASFMPWKRWSSSSRPSSSRICEKASRASAERQS